MICYDPGADLTIKQFAIWWLRTKPFRPPQEVVVQFGYIFGVTLFRDGPFQVQLFIAPPHSAAPKHRHPNVDTIEYYVMGDIKFEPDRLIALPFSKGALLDIDHTNAHIAVAGETGGCFISIQKWLNGVPPTSVEKDWADA